MALQSSFPLTLDQIKQEVFGNQSHPFDFLTCVDSSLIIDKSRPIGFDKFLGYVDDITFTSSPTSAEWEWYENSSNTKSITVVVDSPTATIHHIPTWMIIKDNTNVQLFNNDVINKTGTPSYVLSCAPEYANADYTDKNDNITIWLSAAIGNAYQTQSGTELNIPVKHKHVPIQPYFGGWSIGPDDQYVNDPTDYISSLTDTAYSGISLGSNNIYVTFTPNGSFSSGNRQIQVRVDGVDLHNSEIYMANGVLVNNVALGLNRTLQENEAVIVIVGDDYS